MWMLINCSDTKLIYIKDFSWNNARVCRCHILSVNQYNRVISTCYS